MRMAFIVFVVPPIVCFVVGAVCTWAGWRSRTDEFNRLWDHLRDARDERDLYRAQVTALKQKLYGIEEAVHKAMDEED